MIPIRIGIVGAGENTRKVHIPKLLAIPGVEIAAVCNRSQESGLKVAREFGIRQVCSNWQDIVEDEDIDAILIGTWPDMHELISCGSLMAGKHVLCEARMAKNAAEAREMLRVSRCFPHLVAQVVPAPFTFAYDQNRQKMVKEKFFGDILAINGRFSAADFVSQSDEMSWRENIDISGNNTMLMGIFYESMARWLGHAKSVIAKGLTYSRTKTWEGEVKAVEIPEHLNIIADMHCGAQAQLQFSSVTGLAEHSQEVWIHGSQGTAHLDLAKGCLRAGKREDKELSELELITNKHSSWRVEEEFISAIRGSEKVRLTTFAEGLRYMEFTDAVARSRQSGQAVELPLG
jgi:predicted dehydrogenase